MNARLIIPESIRSEILNSIHEGHLGITKCLARAKESILWPGLSTEIERMISSYNSSSKHRVYHKETMIKGSILVPPVGSWVRFRTLTTEPNPTRGTRIDPPKSEFPERLWQRVGVDLLKLKGKWRVIVADFYSIFFEVALLENQKAQNVIDHIKSIFSGHDIPEIVRSDCGSQFSTTVETTRDYKLFFKKYGFSIVTSSPKYSQRNGFIESMVKNLKTHFEKSVDEYPYLMMLVLRTIPLEN
ncbi:hypothetical protein AVEN_16285-1 [Araneus ventricosus]|uniref:RNA-directed DNA polymerase n=1 Tax=Araneus ventricosus TaxID=182803 RepID=A0A4Y2LSK1_ARAVE|nr:hypothetical protein AVEN_16285-1 [Araneus ventricosus]